MALPKRFDTARTVTLVDPYGYSYVYREWRRKWQKLPYTLPLDYYNHVSFANRWPIAPNFPDPVPPYSATTLVAAFTNTNLYNLARNKAYEALKGKVYTDAQLGVDFVEYRQALGMMASSATTLINVARKIRRGDFLGAKHALGMKILPKDVSIRKSFANNWLEFHFGWEPLVRDIYDAAEVMNNPLKAFSRARGAGSNVDTGSYSEHNVNYNRSEFWRRSYYAVQGLTVDRITNSTLHALDQFGVINPVEIAWELVPFSFVVDWFVNVGQVLNSYSDYAGMQLRDTWNSVLFRLQIAGNLRPYPGSGYPGKCDWTGNVVRMDRQEALGSPVFAMKQLRLPSKVRAATAMSLLVQVLS
ncbi:TPA_asm: maturation protein [ssRNA phage Esthiorhiza.4_19]|uniref:Maturation protein n=2 Tax=Fiersviridae TaxID=2842319 RepID=A0A8S5L1D0_9VIRU|nr:maturation protein [ssRNA phage Esthiorhiza.4_19]QDH89164.1 MAG: hypothetical protein H4RhizoLitter21717_000003 [Leviviridae sp.]DAD51694.1 TPA_asm: maturation protein [ssRNA phage Esthiorhiza.4_19]